MAHRKIAASTLLKKVTGKHPGPTKTNFFTHPSTASKAPRTEFLQKRTVTPQIPTAVPFPPAAKPNPIPVIEKQTKEKKKASDDKAFVPPESAGRPAVKKAFSSISDSEFVALTIHQANSLAFSVSKHAERPRRS